jgi:hypothetical protein
MAVELWVQAWVLGAHSEVYIYHWGHDPNFVHTFDVQAVQQSYASGPADYAKIGLVHPPEVVEDPFDHTLTYFFRVRNVGNTLGNFWIWATSERK